MKFETYLHTVETKSQKKIANNETEKFTSTRQRAKSVTNLLSIEIGRRKNQSEFSAKSIGISNLHLRNL